MQLLSKTFKSLRHLSSKFPKVVPMQIWRYPCIRDEDTIQVVWQGTLYYLPIQKEEIEETEFYTCIELQE